MEKKKIRIYLGIPSTGDRCDAQCYMLRQLEERYGDEIEFVYPKQLVHRIWHDFARNEIVEEFLASDCDILWFLDSDVCPPKHVLDLVTLYGDKWEAAGAPYPIFITPQGESGQQVVYAIYQGRKGDGLVPGSVPRDGQAFVDGLATGCLFLKRSVFARLKKPYFEHKYDPESRKLVGGEDLGFCIKLNDLGIRFFTDYSMICRHYKRVDLLEVNNYAIDYSNKNVIAYDQSIRETMTKLEAHYQAKIRALSKPQSNLILPKGLR